MNRKLRFLFLVFCFGGIAFQVSAQKALRKAKKQFELKAFDLAIENAKKGLQDDPECLECQFIIAESFRMMNNNVDAAIWFRKMEDLPNLPKDFHLHYGHLLKRMGQYDKAQKHFYAYKAFDPIVGEQYAISCDYAKSLLIEKDKYEINLYRASSEYTDYGAAFFKNKIVFSSFRPDFKRALDKENLSHIHPRKNQFFIAAEGTNGQLDNIDFLLNDDYETYEYGPIHYAAKASLCAVTKNNFMDGLRQVYADDLELSLYICKVNHDGSFYNIKAFPYNEVGYATGFGTLNPSGNILYFSSNRPGGFGGFDLYVSYFKNGAWTYPENLGQDVNTPGNEVTPFFDGETLFFSSDYHYGIGGLDVFSSTVEDGLWKQPQNLGNGINSPEDDYYFSQHPLSGNYYFTSNRIGGRGSHDIYMAVQLPGNDRLIADLDAESSIPEPVEVEAITAPTVPDFDKIATVSEDEIAEPRSSIKVVDVQPAQEEAAKGESRDIIRDEEGLVDFDKLLPPKAVKIAGDVSNSFSLAGAKMIALGEIVRTNSNVYFIQIAALFRSRADVRKFAGLTQFGSLYKLVDTRATKIKLGYFMDEYEAKEVLRKIKSMGYSDAFITLDPLNNGRLELIDVSDTTKSNVSSSGFYSDNTDGIQYKVRLASYEDPIWFDINKVSDLGVIEQWSKGDWTIFIMSGYSTLEDAKAARLAAKIRGFKDASIVIDNNGLLEKYEEY